MNPDFIQLKAIEGELKLSRKTNDYGVTVSTKELVLHKPHVNYHIKYNDLISIVPFEIRGKKTHAIRNRREERTELAATSTVNDAYKLYVKAATVHNRSGLSRLGAMQFVLPMHRSLLQVVSDYSGLSQV
ncbi:hypothetical protein IDH44_16320 [Paenibacillus sp. IB182496]|uniref:Uncharacterized protein n=1 Tax=Paenibacillus sabuli TaxID=2772509 RepID=A0A927BTZ0_9BACL|nr:hypothetical protein [Paenibacillus sabuli]MBD2846763.1 hypothetical protein [Paenibacillus sabuli]